MSAALGEARSHSVSRRALEAKEGGLLELAFQKGLLEGEELSVVPFTNTPFGSSNSTVRIRKGYLPLKGTTLSSSPSRKAFWQDNSNRSAR